MKIPPKVCRAHAQELPTWWARSDAAKPKVGSLAQLKVPSFERDHVISFSGHADGLRPMSPDAALRARVIAEAARAAFDTRATPNFRFLSTALGAVHHIPGVMAALEAAATRQQVVSFVAATTEPEQSDYVSGLTRQLNAAFSADQVRVALSRAHPAIVSRFVGYAAQYAVLIDDPRGLAAHIDACVSRTGQHVTLLAQSLAERLSANLDTERGRDTVFAHICDAYTRRGIAFHGFNGSDLLAIRAQGLRATAITDNRLRHTGERLRSRNLFQRHDASREQRRSVFVAQTPVVGYDYALAAPEWLGCFPALRGTESASAYVRRDWSAAREALDTFCAANRELLDDAEIEATELRELIEDAWHTYVTGSPGPALAVCSIPELALELGTSWRTSGYAKDDYQRALSYALGLDGEKNVRVDRDVAAPDVATTIVRI